ncbi:phosphotransferase [Austwickia chelonae]|uniref:phosphotransferase n=1 Tax=Austwickia chelonae TaxID=100225 RepID=UPI00030A0A7F|nr:phosphotransferase [Austwickia chelonae]
MTSEALVLAAMASAAMPGLRPVKAEAVLGRIGERFQVAFVEDVEHRRWVIRLPVDAVAAAQQDASVALLGMLARRLPFAVPAPKGFAELDDGRRAMVYPMISGQPLSFYSLPPGRGLAAELGRAIASLHNVDRGLFDEASVPVYDAEDCRRRHFATLDRAAQTGRVPSGLLSRWENFLDTINLWRFAPTPVHGRLDGTHILASFSSTEDVTSGRIRAVVGWEDARIGDPAEDFAALVASAAPDAIETAFDAYTMSRIEHPDAHLEQRARLLAELRLVEDLLAALSAKDRQEVAATMLALQRLDEEVGEPGTPLAPLRAGSATEDEEKRTAPVEGMGGAGTTPSPPPVASAAVPPEPAAAAAGEGTVRQEGGRTPRVATPDRIYRAGQIDDAGMGSWMSDARMVDAGETIYRASSGNPTAEEPQPLPRTSPRDSTARTPRTEEIPLDENTRDTTPIAYPRTPPARQEPTGPATAPRTEELPLHTAAPAPAEPEATSTARTDTPATPDPTRKETTAATDQTGPDAATQPPTAEEHQTITASLRGLGRRLFGHGKR